MAATLQVAWALRMERENQWEADRDGNSKPLSPKKGGINAEASCYK
jgi:hypothetical protein